MLKSLLPAWLATGNPVGEANPQSVSPQTSAQAKPEDDEISEGDSTPKAKAIGQPDDVPSLTLSGDDEDNTAELDSKVVAPSFPAPNSAQRASAMPPPPKPKAAPPGSNGLMPPPARPPPINRPAPAAGLRVPTTGPLPNRGPPTASQQRVSSSLSPNGAVSTPNARGKVLLKPGHSPMDWAALTRKDNLAGVDTFQRVTPSQLRSMTGRKGKPAWSSWQGKVYNITPYLPFHPGGEAELMKAAGRDGTKLFMDVHPWVNWENMLGSCLVGVMVPEDYGRSSLEDMD